MKKCLGKRLEVPDILLPDIRGLLSFITNTPLSPEQQPIFRDLVAPYCAIPRDYLSNTPLLRAMGFLVSQYGQLGAIPPPPFLSVSPLESMRSGGAIPPLKRGISAILARYPMKTRQMGAIPPSAILSRKGIARYGGYLALGRLVQGWPKHNHNHYFQKKCCASSETGRVRFRRARFQTPSSVSLLALTELRGENSVSSSEPIICVPK